MLLSYFQSTNMSKYFTNYSIFFRIQIRLNMYPIRENHLYISLNWASKPFFNR